MLCRVVLYCLVWWFVYSLSVLVYPSLSICIDNVIFQPLKSFIYRTRTRTKTNTKTRMRAKSCVLCVCVCVWIVGCWSCGCGFVIFIWVLIILELPPSFPGNIRVFIRTLPQFSMYDVRRTIHHPVASRIEPRAASFESPFSSIFSMHSWNLSNLVKARGQPIKD